METKQLKRCIPKLQRENAIRMKHMKNETMETKNDGNQTQWKQTTMETKQKLVDLDMSRKLHIPKSRIARLLQKTLLGLIASHGPL